MVDEGVDFVQDSEICGGDWFLFVSNSDDELSGEFSVGLFAANSKDPNAMEEHSVCYVIPDSEELLVQDTEDQPVESVEVVEGLQAVVREDIACHAQPLEE